MLHTYQANLVNLTGTTCSLIELQDTEDTTSDDQPCLYKSHAHEVSKHPPDYLSLKPMFEWLHADLIKQTFEVTTQYTCLPLSTLLKKQYKSPFPALNVHRRDKPVATNAIYLDAPAVDSGATITQVFVGVESLVTDVYAIKTNWQFINTLKDQVQTWGEPPLSLSVIGLRWK